RPEELRVYLEEAAGISKYKERRKETETRIRHTRENLDRLNDLREEVGKQLQHLARQARQAEQYTAIQAERKIRDAEWKALEFRALDGQLQALREGLAQEETRLQQLIAEQREAERELETGRVRRDEASGVLSRTQAESYEVGGTLARLEQQIAHQREMAERLDKAREETRHALAEIGSHISGDQSRLEELQAAIADAEPRLEALREAAEALADWQQRWDAHHREQNEAARAGDVERTRVDYLDRQALDADRRREQLVAERGALDLEALSQAFEDIALRHEEQKLALDGMGETLEQRKQAAVDLQDQQRNTQGELSDLRKQAQEARGRLSSLETLQHAALG